MLERFHDAFSPLRDSGTAGSAWSPPALAGIEGYEGFSREFSGASFDGGIYRVHDALTGLQAQSLIADAFPDFSQRACPFGYDWLGRQFAVDSERVDRGQPLLLLLEPGTGEVLEIPVSFSDFHDHELVDQPDAALAPDFFRAWSGIDSTPTPLGRDQCAGYKVPLFLGGQDIVDNLEVSDIDVYWSICGQLRQGL